jgi:hypothetical protein
MLNKTETRIQEYKDTYDRIINRSVGRKFIKAAYERHHILPKSMGGTNNKNNLVYLTYREHFLAHWLLTKFTEGQDKIKMLHALAKMTTRSLTNNNRIISCGQYSIARRANSRALSFRMKGNQNTKGRKHTEEWIEDMRLCMKGNQNGKGYIYTPEQRIEKSFRQQGFSNSKGHRHTDEWCKKHSNFLTGNNYAKGCQIRCLNDRKEYTSISSAMKYYNLSRSSISGSLKGKNVYTAGLKFEYIIKEAA